MVNGAATCVFGLVKVKVVIGMVSIVECRKNLQLEGDRQVNQLFSKETCLLARNLRCLLIHHFSLHQ